MARPQKEGIDYFTLDVKMDDEIKLIEARFGVAGFGILIKLYQVIYDNGYYIKWSEREQLLYSNRINADINLISDVVEECLKWDLFDKNIYTKHGVLTSRGIQKRYIEATQRRKEVGFYKELLLLDISEKYSDKVNVNINKLNDSNNSENTDISTQTKLKESKVNKSKRNIFTPPTIEEVEKYCLERNKNVDAEKWYNFYSAKGWMIGKNKMKDWKAAVRTWEKKDKKEDKSYLDQAEKELKEYEKRRGR